MYILKDYFKENDYFYSLRNKTLLEGFYIFFLIYNYFFYIERKLLF